MDNKKIDSDTWVMFFILLGFSILLFLYLASNAPEICREYTVLDFETCTPDYRPATGVACVIIFELLWPVVQYFKGK